MTQVVRFKRPMTMRELCEVTGMNYNTMYYRLTHDKNSEIYTVDDGNNWKIIEVDACSHHTLMSGMRQWSREKCLTS